MRLGKFLLFILSAAFLAAPLPAMAVSIDLGGIRLPLPIIVPDRPRVYDGSSVRSQPRWHVVVQNSRRFATNDQGIWVGHDEAGNMVMQIEVAQAPGAVKSMVAAQIDINGRYFTTVPATVASEHLVAVQGGDVESILGRLMSGRSLRVTVGANVIETHLSGSSAAIRDVRAAAMVQRRLYAEGKVAMPEPADDEPEAGDEDMITYFLPGVAGSGTAEVRFNIIEGTGLVLYAKFSKIPGYGDPEYSIPYTHTEAERAIRLIRKAQDWTDIAVKNRVGLYSKRIGFVDDANGTDDEAEATSAGSGESATDEAKQEASDETAKQAEAETPSVEGKVADAQKADEEVAGKEVAETGAPTKAGDPQNFKAVNFNSYEDGTTSVQLEHAVQGFSRRFNLSLADALKLADSMAETLEYATFRLEKRDFDLEEKDKLFQ